MEIGITRKYFSRYENIQNLYQLLTGNIEKKRLIFRRVSVISK